MSPSTILVGIDLGGTKIEGAILDSSRACEPIVRLRHPTESAKGYEHVLGQICRVVEDLKKKTTARFPEAIGIGMPGTLDPRTQTLRGSNAQCMNGKPLRKDLEKRLGIRVEIENDANCFALAESTLGAARGYETVFGVILGTGCGGGYVVHERVLNGCHGIAASGDRSRSSRRRNFRAWNARNRRIVRGRACAGGILPKGIRTARPLREIAERAEEDPIAKATLERLQDYFAKALGLIVNTFDPHAIVIGGGVGNLDVLYSAQMRERILKHVFAPRFETALLRPRLGDSAGVLRRGDADLVSRYQAGSAGGSEGVVHRLGHPPRFAQVEAPRTSCPAAQNFSGTNQATNPPSARIERSILSPFFTVRAVRTSESFPCRVVGDLDHAIGSRSEEIENHGRFAGNGSIDDSDEPILPMPPGKGRLLADFAFRQNDGLVPDRGNRP